MTAGGETGGDATGALDRASRLHGAGIAANSDMHPALGARRLRAALRILGDAARDDEPRRALRGRVLVSLALAESEQGHIEAGLRLLAVAEDLLPADRRAVLHGQRGMLLRRTGRDDLALIEYARALDLLREHAWFAGDGQRPAQRRYEHGRGERLPGRRRRRDGGDDLVSPGPAIGETARRGPGRGGRPGGGVRVRVLRRGLIRLHRRSR